MVGLGQIFRSFFSRQTHQLSKHDPDFLQNQPNERNSPSTVSGQNLKRGSCNRAIGSPKKKEPSKMLTFIQDKQKRKLFNIIIFISEKQFVVI